MSERAWVAAFNAAANDVASSLLQRGGHGRTLKELRQAVLANLDKDEMSAWFAREFTLRLTQAIRDDLELSLDLRLKRVDSSPSGLMEILMLTARVFDAATVFNCTASTDSTGYIERMRENTASLRHWEWGLLLQRFIAGINTVSGKKGDIYSRLLRQLRKDGIVRGAMVDGLDQKGLRAALYGDVPFDKDIRSHSVH
jgi:hypothetical protein